MNRFNLLKSTSAIIVICLLIVLILGVVVLFPKYQSLEDLQIKIEEKTVQLQYREEHLSNLNKIKTELENYQPELSKIDFALPIDSSLPSFYNFIQRTSSQSGLVLTRISSFTISSSGGPLNIKEIGTDFSVTGSYTAFKNFLSTLEKSARIIEVESISFFSAAEEGPFTFNLEIKIHSY